MRPKWEIDTAIASATLYGKGTEVCAVLPVGSLRYSILPYYKLLTSKTPGTSPLNLSLEEEHRGNYSRFCDLLAKSLLTGAN